MTKPPALPARTENVQIIKIDTFDEIDHIEDEVFLQQLSTEEGAQAYLYYIDPKDPRDGRIRFPDGKARVGPTADFVIQAVRQINALSKGKISLHTLDTPPVITDFMREGKPWVRVISGAVDHVTGEITWGIKQARASSEHTETLLHTKAIRRAFELQPAFNRKRMTKIIKEILKALGIDPKTVVIVGEGQSEFGQFFARARKAGISSDQLRAKVREQTGSGLSKKGTGEQIAAAAEVMDGAIEDAEKRAPGVSAPRPAGIHQQPAAESDLTPGAQDVPATTEASVDRHGMNEPGSTESGQGPAAAPTTSGDGEVPKGPETPSPAALSDEAICAEHIAQLHLAKRTVDDLKRQVGRAGDPHNWARLRIVLEFISVGREKGNAIKAALEKYPLPAEVPS